MVSHIRMVSSEQLDPTSSLKAEDYLFKTDQSSGELELLAEIEAAERLIERIDASPAREHMTLRKARESRQLRSTIRLMREYIEAKKIIQP